MNVAEASRMIFSRKPHEMREPLYVSAEDWIKLRDEVAQYQKKRGEPVWSGDSEFMNFKLRGSEGRSMNVVEAVKLIVGECAKAIPDAQVIAPLAVWDNGEGGMGVQIKAPQMRGEQACEVTASFVLPRADLADALKIQAKGRVAVAAIMQDIQVAIKPVKVIEGKVA